MVTTPMKCRLCGKIIPLPVEIIGETPQQRQMRMVGALMAHITRAIDEEQKTKLSRRHTEAAKLASTQATTIAANMNGALIVQNFDIPEELEAARRDLLRDVHEMTRQVRMTDQELADLYERYKNGTDKWPTSLDFLKDLRDRYESLGKYAPAKPANAPESPVLVKQ